MDEPGAAGAEARVALVVSRGGEVGAACAAALLAQAGPGGRVVLAGAGELPSGVDGVALDGVDAATVTVCVDRVAAEIGAPAVLVTVPGPGIGHSVARAGDDPFDGHIDGELGLVHRAVRAVVPGMLAAKRGRIVLVSSTTALAGAPWETAHGAAMAGIVGLARSLARELASSGITVNVVLAGAIETEHLTAVRDRGPAGAAAIDGAIAATPLRRLGQPADVADAVAFLASDDASYVTGAVLPVDGGLAMGLG